MKKEKIIILFVVSFSNVTIFSEDSSKMLFNCCHFPILFRIIIFFFFWHDTRAQVNTGQTANTFLKGIRKKNNLQKSKGRRAGKKTNKTKRNSKTDQHEKSSIEKYTYIQNLLPHVILLHSSIHLSIEIETHWISLYAMLSWMNYGAFGFPFTFYFSLSPFCCVFFKTNQKKNSFYRSSIQNESNLFVYGWLNANMTANEHMFAVFPQ